MRKTWSFAHLIDDIAKTLSGKVRKLRIQMLYYIIPSIALLNGSSEKAIAADTRGFGSDIYCSSDNLIRCEHPRYCGGWIQAKNCVRFCSVDEKGREMMTDKLSRIALALLQGAIVFEIGCPGVAGVGGMLYIWPMHTNQYGLSLWGAFRPNGRQQGSLVDAEVEDLANCLEKTLK